MPRLYAETDSATPSVGAAPAKRTASEESTGLALSPSTPSRTTRTTVRTRWAENALTLLASWAATHATTESPSASVTEQP